MNSDHNTYPYNHNQPTIKNILITPTPFMLLCYQSPLSSRQPMIQLVYSVLEFYISRIRHYVLFQVWLLFFSTFWDSFVVLSRSILLFKFLSSMPLCGYTIICWWIWGCFGNLEILWIKLLWNSCTSLCEDTGFHFPWAST